VRGQGLARQGQKEQAIGLFRHALRLRPDHVPAHFGLGLTLTDLGRLDEAERSYREVLRLRPDHCDALNNLGGILHQLKRHDDTVITFRRALKLKPEDAGIYSNLGLALYHNRQPAEAMAVLKQAVRLNRDFADAHNNLGLALSELGDVHAAAEHFEQALRLEPRHIKAHCNLGNTYKDQGRLDEALACYDLAHFLDPSAVSPRWNRALVLLQMGDYARGWAEYESRRLKPDSGVRTFPKMPWDGGLLEGRTLLLHTEQGLGDMIQFVRFAAQARARGGRVVLSCPGKLVPLLSRCAGLDQVVDQGGPLPPFDVQAPLLSVPLLLGITLETLPAEVPYLSAEPERVERWRQRLSGASGFRVGVVWQGNPQNPQDRHRSFPLVLLEPLARVEGVRLISLQCGAGTEQLSRPRSWHVLDLSAELAEDVGVFQETAAVIQSLDLVVSADTAVAHLAGALGAPAWVALPKVCDWRWLLGRSDSPWYPTLRLFRQREAGEWGPVIEAMAGELRELVAGRPAAGRVTVEISAGELLDRIARLQFQAERLTDPVQRETVERELRSLEEVRERHLPRWRDQQALVLELQEVQRELLEAREGMQACERDGDCGERFVKLACSLGPLGDRHDRLKRDLGEHFETRRR
jgi:Flp pilus assembly protein TadD